MNKQEFMDAAKKVAAELNIDGDGELKPTLRIILEACCDNPKLFPGKRCPLEKEEKEVFGYLRKKLRAYHKDRAGFALPQNNAAKIDKAMFDVLRGLSEKLRSHSDGH